MKTKRWAKGRCVVKMRGIDKSMWPDPPMVPAVALRRCEQAQSLEEVRAIVHSFLRPKVTNGRRQRNPDAAAPTTRDR